MNTLVFLAEHGEKLSSHSKRRPEVQAKLLDQCLRIVHTCRISYAIIIIYQYIVFPWQYMHSCSHAALGVRVQIVTVCVCVCVCVCPGGEEDSGDGDE